ncbi:MAG: CDP-alcohol phosphatidyltransferase family protein [Patescibacteria group bacterium]
MSIQKKVDGFWQAILIRFLPAWVSPNFFTAIRFILIPVILYFLAIGSFVLVLVFFFLAALDDSIDGSLARSRKQTSPLGETLDPLADKLLIILLSLFLIYFYPYPALILTVAVFDLLLILASVIFFIFFFHKKMPPANWWGKFKMIFQVLGLIAVLVYLIFNWGWLLTVSVILFLLVIIFEFVGFLSYGVKGIF